MDNVNDDLLTNILLRLPAKALIRFKSVSKEWRSLISSDYFCHRHTLRRPVPPPSSLLIETHCGALVYLNHTLKGKNKAIPCTLPLSLARDRNYQIKSACNGLLLLKSTIRIVEHEFSELDRLRTIRYYVHNPTTKQLREIALPLSDDHPYVAAVALAFDPSKSPHYKIVCATCHSWDRPDDEINRVHVYDSEFHEWELKLGDVDCAHVFCFNRGGVLWKDAVHWSMISRYDLVRNEVKNVMQRKYGDLQELDGRLYNFVTKDDYRRRVKKKGFAVEEWEFDGDGCRWALKRNLDIRLPTPPHEYARSQVLRFMGGGGGGEGPTYCLVVHSNGKMRAYSFVEGEYEAAVHFPVSLPGSCYKWSNARAYLFGEVLALV